MTLLWQQTLQQDAVITGLMFTPLALLIVAGNTLFTRLTTRYGSAAVLAAGFACSALGLWLLSVGLASPLSAVFISGIALSGLGHGLIFPAMFAVGLSSTPLNQQGRASALMATSQYMAGAMMLAVLSVVLGPGSRYSTVGNGLPAAGRCRCGRYADCGMSENGLNQGNQRGER